MPVAGPGGRKEGRLNPENAVLRRVQVAVSPDVVVLFAVLAQAGFAAGLLWLALANRVPNLFLALLLAQAPGARPGAS